MVGCASRSTRRKRWHYWAAATTAARRQAVAQAVRSKRQDKRRFYSSGVGKEYCRACCHAGVSTRDLSPHPRSCSSQTFRPTPAGPGDEHPERRMTRAPCNPASQVLFTIAGPDRPPSRAAPALHLQETVTSELGNPLRRRAVDHFGTVRSPSPTRAQAATFRRASQPTSRAPLTLHLSLIHI